MSANDNPMVDLLSTQVTTVDLFKRTNLTVSDLGQLQAATKNCLTLFSIFTMVFYQFRRNIVDAFYWSRVNML